MIEFLQGELVSKMPAAATVAVGGIGFQVRIPLSTFESLPAVGSPVRLITHLHVREDELSLFGFADEVERAMFRMLLGVSRIGPLVALRVVGCCPPAQFKRYVLDGEADTIRSLVKGIGAKTAARLVMELKDAVNDLAVDAGAGHSDGAAFDAVQALVALGLSRVEAEKGVAAARDEAGPDADHQALIQAVLMQ
jgi:holliday junction DNA helicase RuvA